VRGRRLAIGRQERRRRGVAACANECGALTDHGSASRAGLGLAGAWASWRPCLGSWVSVARTVGPADHAARLVTLHLHLSIIITFPARRAGLPAILNRREGRYAPAGFKNPRLRAALRSRYPQSLRLVSARGPPAPRSFSVYQSQLGGLASPPLLQWPLRWRWLQDLAQPRRPRLSVTVFNLWNSWSIQRSALAVVSGPNTPARRRRRSPPKLAPSSGLSSRVW
jgi:hypothetical protein